jgi:outer membrane lipase/esterase
MRQRLLAAAALWTLASPAVAQQTGDVATFGDSLSDPGNIPNLSGGVNFPPSPPYVGNRFSNGPVYSEILPDLLGGSFDPSLNFATGGALTGDANLNSNRPSALPSSDLTGVVLPGIETQVDGFLAAGGRLDEDDLAIVYGGANDIFVAADAAASLPADQIPDLVRNTAATSAENLATSVAKLNAAGGQYFILPNLPDIGATPTFAAGGPDSAALGEAFTRAHNVALNQAAAEVQAQTGANVLVFDVNGVFADIRANPDRYGVTNTTDACIDTPTCVAADQASQNQFLFFDGVHPTTGVHAQVAQILASAVRGPTTIAAQGDLTLIAAEDFQRALIESFNPTSAAAAIALGEDPDARFDTADDDAPDRSTNLFLLADRTEGDREERDGAFGYEYDLTSLTLGLRHRATDLLSFGGALRFGAGDADIDGEAESFNHRQAQVGVSATIGAHHSHITALANVGYAEIRDIERESGVAEVEAEGSTDGFVYGAGLAAGHLFALDEGLRFGPIGSIRYSAADLDGYVESGPAFLSQRVEEQDDIESLVASVGAALELGWDSGDDEQDDVRLRLTALVDRDLDDRDRAIESAVVSSPTTIETEVEGGDRTSGRLGADVAIELVDGLDFGLGYETVIGFEDGDQHSIFGRATISF